MKGRFLIILPLVFCLIQGFSQTESGQRKYRVLTYGLPQRIDDVEMVVNQKWNIEKVSLTGCKVTQKLIDSVKTCNRKTWELIENEHGLENSELEYRKELMKTRRDLNEIKSIVYQNEMINGIWNNLKNKRYNYLIFENPKFIDESKYSISIKKRKRRVDDKPKNRVYNLIVDLSAESITIEN